MPNVIKQGLRQQQRSLSERITALEQGFARVIFSINQQFGALDQKLGLVAEQLEALMELNGVQDVQRIMSEKRLERAKAMSAQEKENLEAGVKNGYVIPAEKVGEKSVLVGRYVNPDGTVQEPGRAQLVIPGLKPEFIEKLVGQTVGYALELPNGAKFELQEIYEVDEEKAKAFEESQAAAQAAEAAQKAGEQAAGDEAKDQELP